MPKNILIFTIAILMIILSSGALLISENEVFRLISGIMLVISGFIALLKGIPLIFTKFK